MGILRKVSIAVGLAQTLIGAFATILAYLLYHNFFGLQTVLNVPQRDVVLFMLIFIVFGLLSIISGLFLTSEQ